MDSDSSNRPWYREPMVWMMIALPMAAVVAGLSTLAIAIRSGSTDAVPDVVRRTLQIQDSDIAADRRAIELALRGELLIDPETGAIEARLDGLDRNEPTLSLRLLHAGRASRDLDVRLVQNGERWLGRVEDTTGQAWNIELASADGSWRVGGRLDPGARSSPLMPLLAGAP
jgi:hypothetical protein